MRGCYVVVCSILLIFSGCSGPDQDDGVESLKITASGVDGSRGSINRAIAAPSGLKISFRSSDIEFWAAGNDFSNLNSSLFTTKEVVNNSISIKLTDSNDNVVYTPDSLNFTQYKAPNFGPYFYNVVRMDIGNGSINYYVDGEKVPVEFSDPGVNGLSQGNIAANSIFFICNSELPEVIYVDQMTMRDIAMTSNTHGLSSFITNFIDSNFPNGESTGDIDMNGALFIPFDGIDLTAGADVGTVEIVISWNLDNVFESGPDESGLYTLVDGPGRTPYDFSVKVVIE